MDISCAAVQARKDGVLLSVHVQPKANRTECVGFYGDAVKVRVAAPPIDGAANEELIRFLADCCSVSRAGISIDAGAHSRQKRVRIRGVTAEHVLTRLLPTSSQGTDKNG